MALAHANGQNKAMMSSKGITSKTRELLAVVMVFTSSAHFSDTRTNASYFNFLNERTELLQQDAPAKGVIINISEVTV